ncbi:hypothetical protein HXX76_000895 [Chlamydomonas incerta]|uniref:TRP C-terminal domain-containing protein n=1 Tax=Chlamydomonas incerta TaxID=51695 RepID=A0A835WF42_CHLIN|nr:hypothetical protein HXX76_000895 [Chlamydomonas incerta]|eukprot:KAG2446307.1 hypothetical protein HXX76_000895 [Chlamydomonas incerta]
MEWSITVGIRPLQLSANNNNATVARPWGDPNLANLDPDPAAGGSLTAEVVGGVATWPRLKVRGWVGPYELFFRAYSPSDATLYQVSDLVVRARILPCMEGEALDLSWAQQSWGQPSWVSCARCSGGQFTLWRDNRPSLSDIDTPHYMQLMMELSQAAAASQAACLRCPNNAICPGGRLLVPNPGYWHSAQDSALLHRCPQQAACGNPMDGRRWPEIHRTQSTAATTLTNANASLSSGLSTGDLPGLSYDARSEWLIVCHQQLGTSSGGGGGTLEVAGNSTSSLVATEAAAAACGSAGGGGYMQLQCAVGYGGNLCATCTPGYFQDSELSCTSCPSLAYTVVIAILALLGTTLLILYTSYVTFEEQITLSRTCSNSLHKPNEKETSAADILKVLIVHVQFYVIVTRLSVPYPDSVSRLAAVTTAITGSENAFVYSHACFVSGLDSEGQARSQLAGTLITPFVVLFLSLLAWLLRRTVSKCLGPALPRAAGQPPQHLAHHQQANILYSRGALEPRGSAAGPARQSPGATIDEEPLPTPTGSDASALYAASAAAVSPTEQLQPQPPFSHGIRASEGGGSAFVTGGGLGAAAAKRAVTSGGGGLLSTATSLRLLGTEGAAVVDFAEDDCRDVSEPLAEATPPKPLRTVLSYAGSSGGTADAHTPSSASAAANVKDAADALAPPLSSAPSAQRRRTQDAAAAATPQGLHTCASGSVMPPPSAFALVQAPSLRGRLSLLRSVDSRPGTPHAPALVTSPSLRTIGSGKLQTALSSISRIPVVAGISESISESYQKSGVRRILSLLDSSLTLGEQLLVVLMITVFIVYPGWANATLSAFTCYIIDDGSTGLFPERQQATWPYGYWIRNMNLQCYTGTHLAVYVPVGVVSFVVLCLAPPVASFAILWRRRRQLTEPQVQLRYGFLYSRYKRRFWYWGSVQMLQQLLLVAVEMFGRALTQVDQQIAVLLVTFTLMALINMACSPAKSRLLTLLDFFSLAVLILTLSLSLFFVTADPLEPAQADAVGILIIAINAALLVSFAALLLRRTWLAVQEKLDKRLRKMWSRVATFKHIRDGAQEVTVEPAAQGHAPGDGLLDPDGQQRAAGANLLPPPPPLQPAASGPPLQPAASGSPLPQSYSATAVLASAAAATQAAASTASAADAGRPREGQQVVLPLPPHPLPAGRMKVVRVGQPPVRPTSSTAQPASYLLHQTSSSTAPKTGTAGHAPGSWSTSQAASQPPSQSSSQPPSQPPSQPSSQPPSQPPSQPSSSQPISTGQPTRLCGQPPRPGVQVTRPELPQVPPQPPQLLQPLFNQQAGGGARARPADQDPTPFALLQHMESLT